MTERAAKSGMLSPPTAEKRPIELTKHDVVRVDEYFWLKNREDPDVIDYLHAENAYTAAVMAETDELQRRLYTEIRGRIKENDETAPYFDNGYWYYLRYEAGDEYPIYARRRAALEAPEEVILDVRELAKGREYTRVVGLDVSRDQRWLTYALDTVGRRLYALFVKDLRTGKTHDLGISGIGPDPHWANDNATLFYTLKDRETLRSYQIHRLKFDAAGNSVPELVFEETDETFSLSVSPTKSHRYLTIVAHSTVSTEYRLIDADKPDHAPVVFEERRRDHEYDLDHDGENFFILSNLDARNFRLMRTTEIAAGTDQWQEILAHRSDTLIEDFEIFQGFIALQEKTNGLTEIQIIDRASGTTRYVDFGEPTYSAYLMDNYHYESGRLRYGYESMTVPDSVFDVDMSNGKRILVREDEVLGGYDASNYTAERVFASAPDGMKIPISLVYHKNTPRDGSAPLLQYAYGSYGHSIDAGFSYSRVSLLDRGFIYAIAHIRGGSDLGRKWYDDGKLLQKKNTFTDFIACSEHLINERYAAPDAVYALGGSAGGLLVGAVMNMRPDLYRGIIAAVPFVDVLTTMLDDDIPLTTGEYDEWGDPNDKRYFDYMLSYSPYDNVRVTDYPHILITAGLHDSQVQYWEPAKWTARLRDRRRGDSLVLLRTNMDAGHGGASGRFEQLVETALEWAFLLKLESERLKAEHG